MKERGKGVILNTSSICGFLASNVSVGYHGAKAGVNLITKVFAKELAPDVRCVAVAPATVRTRLMDPSIEEEASTLHMKHRVEEPDEIAGVFHLLSLDGASAINGTTVMAEDGFCSFKGVW
ncbi:MAG: SDR family oxidoreductase [Clostridium sp.]|nr:SDR family oxidoreductase [Clostridium sp.]